MWKAEVHVGSLSPSKFHCKDPRGLLIGASIPSAMDEVQQLTVTMPLIDLGIEDISNLKLQLTIYKDKQQRWLDSVGDHVQGCGFQHRDMEYWVDSMEVIQKPKGD